MENHQKHPVGNVLIFQYIAQRYRFPKDYASLVYLSQVNQLYCIGLMVEHQRACMPRTMGSLYWQLNDCWPVFSWSSIDFGGQWRGLHYAARRFYAPALVTCRLIGNERVGKINRLVNTVSGVEIVTAYDGNKSEKATLSWDLFRIANGQMILHGEKSITLRPNEAKCSKQLNLEKQFARFGKNDLVLRVILKKNDEIISRNSTLFTAPRFIDLSREKIVPLVNKIADRRFALVFTAKTFQHQLSFHLPGVNYRATDNFFDLFPGEVRSVTIFVEGERRLSVAWVKRNVEVLSVAESY
jgi:beta-mannosidase